MASTKVELVELLLEKQRSLPRSANLAYVIARAKKGKYHDWESSLEDPKSQLIMDLCCCIPASMTVIIDRVKRGEFDEAPTKAQLDCLRSEMDDDEFNKLLGHVSSD